MKNRQIPTLTKRGWIKGSVAERADFILAYFFETLPSESWMFRSNTTSIQELVANHTDDVDGLIDELQRRLEERFRLYFDKTIVSVDYVDVNEYKRTGRADLAIKLIIVEGDQDYSLEREFKQINSVFRSVVKEVNYGQ